MKRTILMLLSGFALILLFNSCKPSTASSSNNAAEPEIVVPTENPQMYAVLYQQTAAEYRALCYQAFNLARMRLEVLVAQHRSAKKLSVVVDIDETMLDNSPYEAWAIINNQAYPDGWDEWMKKSDAKAVPGALDFVKFAQSKGVEVFYITNRKEKYMKETMENLQKLGFPFAKGDHLFFRREESSKKGRRDMVGSQTEIVMLIGDNLADFSEIFEKMDLQQRNDITDRMKEKFGSRFIVLPNAIYGDWLSALYKYDNALTPEQKSTAIKEALRPF